MSHGWKLKPKVGFAIRLRFSSSSELKLEWGAEIGMEVRSRARGQVVPKKRKGRRDRVTSRDRGVSQAPRLGIGARSQMHECRG